MVSIHVISQNLKYKKRKEEENSPSSLKFIQMSFNQALIASSGAA